VGREGITPSVVGVAAERRSPLAGLPRNKSRRGVQRAPRLAPAISRGSSPVERVAETVAAPRQRAVKPRMSEEQREALRNSPDAIKLRRLRDLPENRHPDKEGPLRTDLFAKWRKQAIQSASGYSDETLERNASGVSPLSGTMSRAAARRELKIRAARRDAELASMPSYLDFGD